MKRLLLALETCVTTPFFLASWYACGIWYAIKSGRDCARDDEAKDAVLSEIFRG